MKPLIPLLMLAALVAAPTTAALTVSGPAQTVTLPHTGPGEIEFNVTADCTEFVGVDPLTNLGAMEVTVTATDLPDWLESDSVTVTLQGSACITGSVPPPSSVSAGGALTLTAVNATAPGMDPVSITLTANGATTGVSVQVAYRGGYEFIVDQTFPLEVGHDPVTFNATVRLFGNAATMAMWEIVDRAQYVTVSGFPGGNFLTIGDDRLAGDLEYVQTLVFTVTPPSGDWEEDTLRFRTWSHLDREGANMTTDATPEVLFTWTFVDSPDHADDGRGLPGPGLFVVLLALLGAALLASRRRG